MTFSYFRDYLLKKLITEIGKIRPKFFSLCWREGAQSPWQNWMGAMAGLTPLDPPLPSLQGSEVHTETGKSLELRADKDVLAHSQGRPSHGGMKQKSS